MSFLCSISQIFSVFCRQTSSASCSLKLTSKLSFWMKRSASLTNSRARPCSFGRTYQPISWLKCEQTTTTNPTTRICYKLSQIVKTTAARLFPSCAIWSTRRSLVVPVSLNSSTARFDAVVRNSQRFM